MAQIAAFEERVAFGSGVPPQVNALLQSAVAAYDDSARAEALLWEAQRMAPEQLPVYTALYKFYFYKYRLAEAADAARLGLAAAAGQGGFAEDWQRLDRDCARWDRADGPELAYLYSLKALGFISLRQGERDLGARILDKLRELDPEDRVGGSVIQDLLSALDGDDDD
jgi:tetratricopeptide (TPR) repeat protein